MKHRTFDGAAYRARRQTLGLTQQQAADLAGVSLSFLKLVETGKTQPSDPFAAVLATSIDVPLDRLSTPKSQTRKPKAA